MSAGKDLNMVTINRLRVDMARTHAIEYRALLVLRGQLRRQVDRGYRDHSPKTRVQG